MSAAQSLVPQRRFRPQIVVRLGIVVSLGFFWARTSRAQETAIDDLAAKMAANLKAAKQQKITVFDFVGPGQQLTRLGTKLADDFALALVKSNEGLSVEDRTHTLAGMRLEGYSVGALLDSKTTFLAARSLNAQVAILGTIARDEDRLKISVAATNLKDNTLIDSRDATIPVTSQMVGQIQTYFEYPPPAGRNGYSMPGCRHCPSADYSRDALAARFEGVVILMAIITPEGQAQIIKVMQELSYGLTDNAIEAVRQWRFTAARGPDGKPAAVRQIIDVSFHLITGLERKS